MSISQSALHNRQNRLSDDLSGFKGRKKAAGAAFGRGGANSLMITVFSYSNLGDFDGGGCQDSAAVRLYQEDERVV